MSQRHAWLALLLLTAAGSLLPAGEVRVEKDVAYLPEGRTEKLDLYLPAEGAAGEKRPGVVIIHGGGWTGGDKGARREQNIGNTLAAHGYVCASINYVLADKKDANFMLRLEQVFPQHLHDCRHAVRWLRANAERLQLDTEHIGVIGGSAGGHLAAMVGVAGNAELSGEQGPLAKFSPQVQAVVPMYGAHDLVYRAQEQEIWEEASNKLKELVRQGSPVTHIDKLDPPMLILHGTKDALVPVSQSERLAAALKEAGVEHQLLVIEGAPHSFHLQPAQQDLRPIVLGFFDKHLKGKQ